jgi:hypothetical protein
VRHAQVLRLVRLSKLTDKLAGTSSMTSVVSIVKLYLVVVLLAHWIACIWFSLVAVSVSVICWAGARACLRSSSRARAVGARER